jgi:hypothetical protein
MFSIKGFIHAVKVEAARQRILAQQAKQVNQPAPVEQPKAPRIARTAAEARLMAEKAIRRAEARRAEKAIRRVEAKAETRVEEVCRRAKKVRLQAEKAIRRAEARRAEANTRVEAKAETRVEEVCRRAKKVRLQAMVKFQDQNKPYRNQNKVVTNIIAIAFAVISFAWLLP